MRSGLVAIAVLVILVAAGIAVAYRPAIDPVAPRPPSAFDPQLVSRGAQLAAIGNCISCHTAEFGEPYAGGYAMETPFGTIHGTNITPEPETGIGRWSEAAFIRAMREGVARDGRHLYPAFPYNHFTKTDDQDLRAIYAFLMTRRPVRAKAPENELPFPLNWRVLLAGWNLLFLDDGRYEADPERSPEWNRGAYLVEGLAHCGACHTPRNALGAEDADRKLAGGAAEGWDAPALDASSPAPVPWDAEAMTRYLRDGWHELHGAAAGPMAPVAENLADVPEEDVRSMAVYIASIAGEPSQERRKRAAEITAAVTDRHGGLPAAGTVQADGIAASLYAGACAVCHDTGRGIDLVLSTAVNAPDPRNLLRVILEGVTPPPGKSGPFMPGYAGVFNDEQLAALITYLRGRYSDRPVWGELQDRIHEVQQGND